MKVLQIIPGFGMGGAERIVINYLKHGNTDDIEMRAISLYPDDNNANHREIKEHNLPVTYLNKKLGLDFSVVKDLKKEIRTFKPDIIHTHLHALKYVLLTGEHRHATLFHTIHATPGKDTTKSDRKINKYCFQKKIATPIALQASLAQEINEYYNINTTRVVPNGICLEDYRHADLHLKENLAIPQNAFVVGHIGSFKEAKNHDFIIDVFKELLCKQENAYLLLIGTGPLMEQIQSKAQEYEIESHVKFLGNRSDISELLHIMDVFLFPSVWEGFGLVAIEAQAAGIKCIMSDAVPKEVVVSPQARRLSLQAPHQDWVQALLDDTYRNNLYINIQEYDIHNVIAELVDVYKHVVQE